MCMDIRGHRDKIKGTYKMITGTLHQSEYIIMTKLLIAVSAARKATSTLNSSVRKSWYQPTFKKALTPKLTTLEHVK